MVNTLPEKYEKVYQLNIDLLMLARQGNWDEFIQLAEIYIASVSDILKRQPQPLPEQDEKDLASLFRNLLSNEVEIERTLQARLDLLKKDMSSLHVGKKCSEAYSRQYSSAFH